MEIAVMLHDGRIINTTVDEYSVENLLKDVNSLEKIAVNIGDVIVSKNTIRLIAPAEFLTKDNSN